MPYVICKCAISADGCLDDASHQRLMLSDEFDFDSVDEVRSTCDAILVGANTVRADNPRLMIRSEARRADRIKRGHSPDPIKVTLTNSGELDASFNFFTAGESPRFVYCPEIQKINIQQRIGKFAEVIAAGYESVDLHAVVHDLDAKGIKRLLVEGGSLIGSAFLQADLVDELQVSVAPFFVGQGLAPRFATEGHYPHDQHKRMALERVEKIGDMALITWKLARKH